MHAQLLGWLLCCLAAAKTVPPDRPGAFTLESFRQPPVAARPRYRYWLPDASVDPELVADDIAQLGDRGGGGIALLPYYSYGGIQGPEGTDWDLYGYGTPAYRSILKSALQVHKDKGLLMDLAMGPQSGQGVPAKPDETGLTWELVSFNLTLSNGTYVGEVPGWGEGDLVSVVTFAILNQTNISTLFGPGKFFGRDMEYNYTQYTISASSLKDVTNLVHGNGSITVSPTTIDGAQAQMLYASYARRSYERACIASSTNPQDILQNGSFAVDHFSEAGARLSTAFMEEHVLIDGIKELLMEVGQYIWEDSVEIHSDVFWTPGLDAIFEEQHGYSIKDQVLLLSGNAGFQAEGGGPIQFVSDAPDNGYGFVSDHRSTMSSLLPNYVSTVSRWAHDYLGLGFSHQVGYNLPVDMAQVVPSPDTPETETLSFFNNIDHFRQFCGAANLAGKSVITIELGADQYQAYTQSWTTLLSEAKRAFVAGVNSVVFHGATYSHWYPNTTWPGFTTFAYLFGGQHSRHKPSWDVGYRQANDYLARTQLVLRTGTPKVDIAFWDKQTAQPAYPQTLYAPTDLVALGYTYQYLSPENFALENAFVQDGKLAPRQQQFQVLVVRQNDTLTTTGVDHLHSFAAAGLPIVISGGRPSRYASSNATAVSIAQDLLEDLAHLDNVHLVDDGPLGNVLMDLNITPRSAITSNGTWYTSWREDEDGDVYVFVYNDGLHSTANITFATTSIPYKLDAWTGEQSQVSRYSVVNGSTTIHMELESTEATILRFSSPGSQDMPNQVDRQYLPPTSLSNWTLTVEQWLPPQDLFDIESVAQRTNITIIGLGPYLSSWSDLNLTSASGLGHYTTDFNWSNSNSTGAILVIPPVYEGIIGSINNQELPPLDIANPKVDITRFLVNGSNRISLTVSTTLWNSLIPVWSDLMTQGVSPAMPVEVIQGAGFPPTENGIIGEVKLLMYQASE